MVKLLSKFRLMGEGVSISKGAAAATRTRYLHTVVRIFTVFSKKSSDANKYWAR